MARKLLTEFIGTFFLVLTIGLAVLFKSSLAPIAIGSILMAMVYLGGHVSGAHYNPAVSIAITLRGKLAPKLLVPYIVAQFAGAMAASLAVYTVLGHTFAPAPVASVSKFAAFSIEVLFSFALSLVVLNVATSSATEGNSYYGLAIGFTVMAGAAAGGPISGGVFNPAVGVGMGIVSAMLGGEHGGNLWLYIAGPVLGAVLAAAVFRLQESTA